MVGDDRMAGCRLHRRVSDRLCVPVDDRWTTKPGATSQNEMSSTIHRAYYHSYQFFNS